MQVLKEEYASDIYQFNKKLEMMSFQSGFTFGKQKKRQSLLNGVDRAQRMFEVVPDNCGRVVTCELEHCCGAYKILF